MTLTARVLALLQKVKQMTVSEIAATTHRSRQQIGGALENLLMQGRIERVCLGTYRAIREEKPEPPPAPKTDSFIRPLRRDELMRGKA